MQKQPERILKEIEERRERVADCDVGVHELAKLVGDDFPWLVARVRELEVELHKRTLAWKSADNLIVLIESENENLTKERDALREQVASLKLDVRALNGNSSGAFAMACEQQVEIETLREWQKRARTILICPDPSPCFSCAALAEQLLAEVPNAETSAPAAAKTDEEGEDGWWKR